MGRPATISLGMCIGPMTAPHTISTLARHLYLNLICTKPGAATECRNAAIQMEGALKSYPPGCRKLRTHRLWHALDGRVIWFDRLVRSRWVLGFEFSLPGVSQKRDGCLLVCPSLEIG